PDSKMAGQGLAALLLMAPHLTCASRLSPRPRSRRALRRPRAAVCRPPGALLTSHSTSTRCPGTAWAPRADGKVKKRTLANLTHWPEPLVEGLRTLLRGGVALETADQALTISRSLPHGHVAAVLGTAELLDLPKLLTERLGGAMARRYRDLVLALIVNRVIAPASK